MKKYIVGSMLLTPMASIAQTNESNSLISDTLERVVVVGNFHKTSVQQANREVQIIDKATIAKLPVRNVDELLRYVAGLDIKQRGTQGVQSDVTIDGGTFDQSLLLLNGMVVNDPQTGHNMLVLPINIQDIERIEVIRGSAASLYGVNALLGAINIVTTQSKESTVRLHVNTGSSFTRDTATDATYYDAMLNASGNLVTDNIHQLVSFQMATGNGYQYNSAFDNLKFYYQGNTINSEKTALFWQLGHARNDFGANGFYAAPGDKNSHEKVNTSLANIQLQQELSKYWQMQLRVGYQLKNDDYKYIVEPLLGHNVHKTHIGNIEWNNVIRTSFGTWNIGSAFRKELLNSTNLGERSRDNWGGFAGYKRHWGNKLQLNVQAYANYNSQYGWQLYPGLDLGGNIINGLKWYVNVGKAQRLPTYTDLYYNQANLIIGNSNLKPEQSTSWSGGLKYAYQNSQIQVLVFYRTIDNFIDWVRDDISAPWQPQNFQSVNTFGASFIYQNTIDFNGTFITKLGYKLAYNYLNPSIEFPNQQQISRYAISSLKHQLITHVDIHLGNYFVITPAVRYQERVSYKDYWMTNIRLSFNQKKWTVYIDADNVFNEKVIEAGANPLPGFWSHIGLRYTLF